MKASNSIFIIALLVFLSACTSSKLIIKHSEGKNSIKEDMSIAVTEKGQPYVFNKDCKSICKDCSPQLSAQRMKIDSLNGTYVVLKRELAFKYDTIPQEVFKRRTKHEKKTHLEIVLNINKRPHYVYKIPTEVVRQKFYFDSLEAITYSYKDECYKGGPFKFVSNPNKIRRIFLKDAEIEFKRR